MRVNLENCIANSGAAPEYRAALENLVTNLKELRDRTGAGDLAALSEFFEIYRFNDSEQAPQLNTIAIRPRPIIDPGEVEEVALLAHFRTRPCVMVVLAGHLAERGTLGGEAMAPAPEGEDQAGWDQIATISNVDLDHPEVCKDVAEQLRQLAEELGEMAG